MRRSLVAVAAAAVCATAFVAATSPTAQAATTSRIPAHVFAPYFEAYNGDSLSGLSSQSGDKFLTLAFVQTPSQGSCTVYFNGDTSMPIASGTFGSDISAIRASGGDVIPSFGGYAADNCSGVAQSTWQFSKTMQTFTSGTTSTPPTTTPTTAPTTTPPTTTPTTPPTTAPGTTTWAPYTAYTVGQIVTYNGKRYQCRQSHTSLPGWEPPNVLALWLPL